MKMKRERERVDIWVCQRRVTLFVVVAASSSP